MSTFYVISCHGKEGTPLGNKARHLRTIVSELNGQFIAPQLSHSRPVKENIDQIAELSRRWSDAPLLLVGSSRGAYLAIKCAEILNAEQTIVQGLFLMAPAVFVEASYYIDQEYTRSCPVTHVVHGWRDRIIPPDSAIRYSRLISARLTILDDEHRLRDSIDQLGRLFRCFLNEAISSKYLSVRKES